MRSFISLTHKRTPVSKGFSLVEMLVYVAVLIIVMGGSLTLLFSLSDRIQEQRANQLVVHAAQTTLEHMLLHIRNGDAVDILNSTLTANPGELTIINGATTTSYALVSNQVELVQNSTPLGSLTNENVTVQQLRFFRYDNGDTEMVRIVLTLSAQVGETIVTKTFNAGGTLRGSYE
jgi:type II secretory pathway pseudopilin PulG